MNFKNINKFYVYRWIRLDTNTPFYVGKGHGNRYKEKTRHRNPYFINIINTIPCKSEIIINNLKEKLAFEKEIRFIALYRKYGYCEANMTDGGEGAKGRKNTEEQKRNISLRQLGKKKKPVSIEGRINMGKWQIGRKLSKSHIQNMSKSKKGIIKPDNTKLKMSKKIIIKRIDSDEIVTFNSIGLFLKYFSISRETLRRYRLGLIKNIQESTISNLSNNWIIEYIGRF